MTLKDFLEFPWHTVEPVVSVHCWYRHIHIPTYLPTYIHTSCIHVAIHKLISFTKLNAMLTSGWEKQGQNRLIQNRKSITIYN